MHHVYLILTILYLSFINVSSDCKNMVFTASDPGFTDANFETMKSYFLSNLNVKGNGGVIASPDTTTPGIGGGNYSFDWERDGSLSMRAFMHINDFDLNTIYTNMESYLQWVLRVQNEKDPNGFDVRIEPKYNLPNGDVYTGGWGRPQTDGPGLRASTLCLYAQTLLVNGKSAEVQSYLWTNDENKYHGGAIKYDLDWIAEHWSNTPSFDLWEDDYTTSIFWNKIHQRKALVYGSQIAFKMGDNTSGNNYQKVAAQIANSIQSDHWNGNYFIEAPNRFKDAAVVCGFNLGYADDEFLKPTDVNVAQTVQTLNTYFCDAYPINNYDSNNKIPGILYGRYENDQYFNGNPWVLSSANLATLFYRCAQYIYQNKNVYTQVLSDAEYAAWKTVLNIQTSFLNANDRDLSMATSFMEAGDAVLQRIHYHVKGDNFHLAEQLDKNTGVQSSAKDLTWSYADVLVSLKIRKETLSLKSDLNSFATTN